MPTIIFTIQPFSRNEMTFGFFFFFPPADGVPLKCHCLADGYAITLKVTNLMLFLIDSSFYPTLAETHVLAKYV